MHASILTLAVCLVDPISGILVLRTVVVNLEVPAGNLSVVLSSAPGSDFISPNASLAYFVNPP